MELRQAKKGEEIFVSDLAVQVFKPNMKEQFIRLFHERNVDHIFVAVDQEKIVSALNYYAADVVSDKGIFKTGSIGAVLTLNAYQGQGISSKLLLMAEDQMMKEHIDFCIISGRRGLYQRFGARDVGAINRFMWKPKQSLTEDLDIALYQGDEDTLYQIYQKEMIYYVRDRDEFHDLLVAQTYPDSYQTYPIYVISHLGEVKAYVIAIDHHEKKELGIKEFAGDRKWIAQALPMIMEMHQKESIDLMTYHQDTIQSFIDVEPIRMTQQATLKIVDKTSFYAKLNDYANQNDLSVQLMYQSDKNLLYVRQKAYELTDEAMLQLIFSGFHSLEVAESDQKELSQLFPIDLPWSHNLNYQ